MDRQKRKVWRAGRTSLKGLAIEQSESLSTQQVRDGIAAVTIEVDDFDPLLLKQPRCAVQHWKFVLFDIDLQHQVAEWQRQSVKPFAFNIDQAIALTRRRNLKNAGCHAAGKSQLHRVIGGANIQNLDIRTSQ